MESPPRARGTAYPAALSEVRNCVPVLAYRTDRRVELGPAPDDSQKFRRSTSKLALASGPGVGRSLPGRYRSLPRLQVFVRGAEKIWHSLYSPAAFRSLRLAPMSLR